MLFHESTKAILDWLVQQPNVKEESITDWLLFNLSKRCRQLKYYAFSRHIESANGADWEWWVLTTHYAYRFRVQAKKVKPRADNYSAICYSNSNGMQIDLLLASSKTDSAFPLYMFYSSEEQDTSSVLEYYPCAELSEIIKWCKPCSNGAFLSPAQLVYDEVLAKPKAVISASTLVDISLKLSSLDLVFRSGDSNSINATVEQYLNKLDRQCQQTKQNGFRHSFENNSNRYLHGTVPHWLSFIIGDKQSNVELSDWFEGEFRHQLPNVAGVAVLDLRQGFDIQE